MQWTDAFWGVVKGDELVLVVVNDDVERKHSDVPTALLILVLFINQNASRFRPHRVYARVLT